MYRNPKAPYRAVRIRLFAINLGALITVLVILIPIVYTLMAGELYEVLDYQLRGSAAHIMRSYVQKLDSHVQSPDPQQQDSFSLWRIARKPSGFSAEFIDGNPFVDIQDLYQQASQNARGTFSTVRINALPYRVFSGLVHTEKGIYLIYVTKQAETTNNTLNSLVWTLTVSGAAALAVIFGLAIYLTSRSISPMVASWRRQQQFVADASHELRTPLTIIKTNLDVLLRNPQHTIDSEMHYLGNAYAEVRRTNSLIEDLLTLARADSQEQLIEKHPVNMTSVVEEVIETVQPMAEEQNKTISATHSPSPCHTLGDKVRLRQLLLILIDNALRYSNPGAHVNVRIECNTLHTTVTVSDTGLGIDPKFLPHIFDRFVRGDAARHRQHQGSGLGLAIAKWIVEAHDGDITVSSELNKGTTVSVILPP